MLEGGGGVAVPSLVGAGGVGVRMAGQVGDDISVQRRGRALWRPPGVVVLPPNEPSARFSKGSPGRVV
jgi:hypothetical protein